MPCMQLDSISSAFGGICKLDVRSQCLLLAAILTLVLPLEIHHLLAAFIGAAGYSLLQWLEPAVRRKDKPLAKSAKLPRASAGAPAAQVRPERIRRGFTAAEGQKWGALREMAPTPAATPGTLIPAAAPVKPEVRRPSVMPVKAPKFLASGWENEVQELLLQLKTTDASREQVESVAAAVRAALGGSASVRAFAVAQPLAGAAFGVAVPEVEVVVTIDAKAGRDSKLQKSLIRSCTDRLVSHGAFKFRRSAFRGSEPKVTLIAPQAQASIPFNLAVNTEGPRHCVDLFEACARVPHAQDLILLVRRWAKEPALPGRACNPKVLSFAIHSVPFF
ncbi:unnamed protein product [Effrenium voratum]|uniref:Uncharacterized protein n=1 Tax=Effrenium voratum TaxID=2562239 RepID=A0AA36J777_9DINO|nr:unnamed protein product [Effrenium voratum]CAJ1417053.1 unnamed protein product [Effrenium voratum]